MRYSAHQLAYFARQLTLRGAANSIDRMAGTLLDAQVDLNPHQIDAALFATSNPLSKGVILADEVGLGKTIEAGLLIAQRWAERKRRILIIVPANLRKQWHQELADKFNLAAEILEAKSFRQAAKAGVVNPFESRRIVICSYQFAAGKADSVRNVPWDLVVVDEAHRLRNVYKPENKTARTLRDALGHARKVLLTATPLQNTILELYGLVSFIVRGLASRCSLPRETLMESQPGFTNRRCTAIDAQQWRPLVYGGGHPVFRRYSSRDTSRSAGRFGLALKFPDLNIPHKQGPVFAAREPSVVRSVARFAHRQFR